MKKLLRFLLFSMFFAWFGKDGKAQSTQIGPDCSIPFSFSAAGGRTPSGGFQNFSTSGQVGCVVWVVTYRSQGFSALSLRVESAADTLSTGVHVPSTWGAFAGAILDGNAGSATTGPGVNPNTDADWGFTMLKGSPAWVSITLTSKTGTGSVSGALLGWRPHGVDQTTAAAGPPPGGTCPGGSVDGEVQFKDGADCGGNTGFTFNKATGTLSIGATVPPSPLPSQFLYVASGGDSSTPDCYTGTDPALFPAWVRNFYLNSDQCIIAYFGTSQNRYSNLQTVMYTTDIGEPSIEALSITTGVGDGGNIIPGILGVGNYDGAMGTTMRDKLVGITAYARADQGTVTNGAGFYAQQPPSGDFTNYAGYISAVAASIGSRAFDDIGGAGFRSTSLAGTGDRALCVHEDGTIYAATGTSCP